MKCPKCSYVSHDYLDACRKCGIDLVTFKQDIGLLVFQPGVLDLSLVLGGAGDDDLFESVDEEVAMRPSDDDDFDIRLDDYAEQPVLRRAPAGAPRRGGREAEDDLPGMDHLTLELDASDLPADMTARLRAAQVIPAVPPTPPTPPVLPRVSLPASSLPGHLTVEMEPEERRSPGLPSNAFQETTSVVPLLPPQGLPETPDSQDLASSLPLDVGHIDFGPMPSAAQTPAAASIDEVGAESTDEPVSVVDFSGAIASLQLQDVVLADDMLAAPEEPEPEIVEPTLPTIELVEVETTFAQMEAERRAAAAETEAATSTVADSVEFSAEHFVFAMEDDELSGRVLSDVVEPVLTPLDEPPLEDMHLLPSLEFELDALDAAEATLADLAAPTLDEASLTSPDEDVPRPPSSPALTSPAAEAERTLEEALSLSDMFSLEDLEASMLPGHLTLEMSMLPLPPEVASHLVEDAPRPPPSDDQETAAARPGADADADFPAAAALTPVDLDDFALPEHLTIEFDVPEMSSNISAILLDKLQREDLPGEVTSKMPPAGDRGEDEEELILDLEDLEFDDDKDDKSV